MGITTTSDARLEAALRSGGHRVTSQRLVLYRVLSELASETLRKRLRTIAISTSSHDTTT